MRLPHCHDRPRSVCSPAAIRIVVTLLLALSAAAEGWRASPQPAAVAAFRQADHVAILPVHGEIDRTTFVSLERRIRVAARRGATAIVLEIDTPGGEVMAALDICSLLKDRAIVPANVVAWVRPRAFSAGTIIALACREIIIVSNGSFGDAAPIRAIPGMGLVPMEAAERAKIESPILAEVIDSARRNHYDENIVQSFVSVGIELWMLQHRDTGELAAVDRAEYRQVFGEDPPQQIVTVAPAIPSADPAQPRLQRRFGGRGSRRTAPSQPGPSADELRQQIEYQALPPSRAPLTADDAASWQLVEQIVSADRLLTLHAPEAIDYGLATAVIDTEEALRAYFGAATITRLEPLWSEGLVRFLMSWPVRIVLVALFLVGFFVEMLAPGVSAFGLTAVAALALLVGAPYLAGLAEWWNLVLILAGVALVGFEVFITPGVGLAGFAGVAAVLTGLVATFVSSDIRTNEGQAELVSGILTTLAGLFGAIALFWVVSRHLQSFPAFRRFVLQTEVTGHEEPVGALHAMGPSAEARLAPGEVGVTVTELRPAGRARFGDRLIDVQGTGLFIERGARIRIVRVEGIVPEVEPVDVQEVPTSREPSA
ncbi:MAG: hypothetical protein KF817_13665 [Phycisphaeraceae bacterium]|nr:hypothetical protein [Phycisphaeraceae bacterium]